MLIDPEESVLFELCIWDQFDFKVFEWDWFFNSASHSTKESGDSDPANLKVEVDNFLPFFVDPGSNSIACSCKESSKSDTEGFYCSSHSKFDGEQGETRDIIEEPAKSNGNLEDDNTPL